MTAFNPAAFICHELPFHFRSITSDIVCPVTSRLSDQAITPRELKSCGDAIVQVWQGLLFESFAECAYRGGIVTSDGGDEFGGGFAAASKVQVCRVSVGLGVGSLELDMKC